MNTKRKSIKSRIVVGLAIVFAFISTTASSCTDEGTGGPKLPDNLGGVPILQGLQEASKLLP